MHIDVRCRVLKFAIRVVLGQGPLLCGFDRINVFKIDVFSVNVPVMGTKWHDRREILVKLWRMQKMALPPFVEDIRRTSSAFWGTSRHHLLQSRSFSALPHHGS